MGGRRYRFTFLCCVACLSAYLLCLLLKGKTNKDKHVVGYMYWFCGKSLNAQKENVGKYFLKVQGLFHLCHIYGFQSSSKYNVNVVRLFKE